MGWLKPTCRNGLLVLTKIHPFDLTACAASFSGRERGPNWSSGAEMVSGDRNGLRKRNGLRGPKWSSLPFPDERGFLGAEGCSTRPSGRLTGILVSTRVAFITGGISGIATTLVRRYQPAFPSFFMAPSLCSVGKTVTVSITRFRSLDPAILSSGERLDYEIVPVRNFGCMYMS
jgi:hypothetical protein